MKECVDFVAGDTFKKLCDKYFRIGGDPWDDVVAMLVANLDYEIYGMCGYEEPEKINKEKLSETDISYKTISKTIKDIMSARTFPIFELMLNNDEFYNADAIKKILN